MRLASGFFIAVLIAAGTAYGYGTIVGSFVSPGSYPDGLAPTTWSPGIIWVSCAGNDRVYRCDSTGYIYAYWTAPGGAAGGLGSGYISPDHLLWSVNPSNGYCYRVTVSGSIMGSFSTGTTTVGAAYGNTNGYLYTTRTSTNRLYVRNPLTGSIYTSYNLNFTPGDVGFDNRGYLWCAAPQQSRIYQLSPTASVVNSFPVVPGTPYGCDFDGTTVWVGTVGTQHMVYRYEVGLGGAVEPASVGRIKAIYR